MDTNTIRVIATKVLRRMVGCFDDVDEIAVDVDHNGVCVVYTSTRNTLAANDLTQMKCRADIRSGQMWVADLRVASPLRSNGIGRQLVAAAETLAAHLGLRTLNAFPLVSARRFWIKMGYTSHPNMARVVKKDLPKPCPAGLSLQNPAIPDQHADSGRP